MIRGSTMKDGESSVMLLLFACGVASELLFWDSSLTPNCGAIEM